jgi:hypothetical protein
MSVTIDQAFCKQYSSLLYLLSQQLASRFSMCVRNESVTKAEEAYFNRIGVPDEPEEKTTRHTPTPLSEPNISRRKVTPVLWHMGTPLDDDDLDRMVIEPSNWVVQTQKASLGRKLDKIIRDAALGTAAIGKEGDSTVAFKDESISIDGDAGGTATTLGTLAAVGTVADIDLGKVLLMLRLYGDEEVDPIIPKYWAITPKDVEDLLNITEVGSADYNTVKALAAGKVETFAGFKFIQVSPTSHNAQTGIITSDAATGTAHRTFSWAEDGIICAKIGDITTRADERKDLSYLTQIYSKMDLGAVRMEGAKVHECLNKIA